MSFNHDELPSREDVALAKLTQLLDAIFIWVAIGTEGVVTNAIGNLYIKAVVWSNGQFDLEVCEKMNGSKLLLCLREVSIASLATYKGTAVAAIQHHFQSATSAAKK